MSFAVYNRKTYCFFTEYLDCISVRLKKFTMV